MEARSCKICSKQFVPYFKVQQTCSRKCANQAIGNSKRSPLRTCKGCGVSFQPLKTKSTYCTHDCYAKRFGTVTKQCETCSKTFTVAYRFRAQKACGMECAKAIIAKTLTTAVTRDCARCGEPFTKNLYSVAHEAALYCSRTCADDARWGVERHTDVILTCEGCGVDFTKSFIKRHARFCSKTCALSNTRWNRDGVDKSDPQYIKTVEKMSNIVADKIVAGEWPTKTVYENGWHSSPKCGRQYYRSSYERRYFLMLDADQTVLSYESEPFKIPYRFDGSTKNYTPDVLVEYVDGSRALVEVKPEVLTREAKNLAKAEAAQRWCKANDVRFLTATEGELN